MNYLEIFFEKGQTCGIPAVGLDEEGTDSLGESIKGRITGNGRNIIFKGWEDIDGHIMSHRGPLVCKINEGVQVKYGSDK